MSTLTSSLLEDATLTSLENDTIQDGMIEDLFNPANFSETETCEEIMVTNRSSRGTSRSHASRRTNKSSSTTSRKSKERKIPGSTAGTAFSSVPGVMSPVDEEIANMVREDVRKMIATVRSAKAQQPKHRNDLGDDQPAEKKMLVRPGKYGECDRSPRKQMLKKIRKEKLKKQATSKPKEESPTDEEREDHSQEGTSEKSHKSVESMKKGYYKNLRQHSPEHMARNVGGKGKELNAPRNNEEVPTSTASVSMSISSRRSHLSKAQAKSGNSVATSKSQPKNGELSKTPSKTSGEAPETAPIRPKEDTPRSPKEDEAPSTASIEPKKSSSGVAPVSATDTPLSGSSAGGESPAKSDASVAAPKNDTALESSAISKSASKNSVSATVTTQAMTIESSLASKGHKKSMSGASSVAVESSLASKGHKKSVSGASSVAFKDQVRSAPLASFEGEGTNKPPEDEAEKEDKKKDTESVVLAHAQTAMTESETRLEEDNSVLTGSVLTESVVFGRGDLTVTEVDETEDNNSTCSNPADEDAGQLQSMKSMSTISYRMTQIEASKEEDVSEEIECVLAPFDELNNEPRPSIKPDPSAAHDNQGQRKEPTVSKQDPVERGAAPPGDGPADKNQKVAPDDSSLAVEKSSVEEKKLRGQEAPARSSQSLIAAMQDEEDCTLDEVSSPGEEVSEEDAGETTAGETTTAETASETNTGGEVGDEKKLELVLVDESVRLKQLEIENAKLKDTLHFLQRTAVDKEKYFAELAWFGKRSEEEVQKWRPNFWRERLEDLGPELFEEFRADAMRIADPDVGDWEHGFSSGALAMARLLLGLSHAVDDEKICVYHDPGQPCGPHCVTCSVADQRKRELADFPVLDP